MLTIPTEDELKKIYFIPRNLAYQKKDGQGRNWMVKHNHLGFDCCFCDIVQVYAYICETDTEMMFPVCVECVYERIIE